MIGKMLGHYQITNQLGKGGMGEVFQAKDQILGREVAIKVLPEEFARDSDRVARFQREAKVLASLNHPNIAAIHGLEQSEGTNFLVLELVEGETLADRIKTGPIPVEESLKLALQIAEALEAAQEKGVIHRDLKPSNIKVTPDGKVKVLDFGLAKAYAGDKEEVNLSNSPTLSDAATQQGVILGTAAYMSPEQARGKAVDRRADIWAFGCVLYEMLTGRAAFSGKDVTDILAAVIRTEPEWKRLPVNLHWRLREVLERCLEKEAKDRYSGINDARVEIQKALADPSGVLMQPGTAAEPRRKLKTILPWAATTLVLGLIVAGVAVWKLKPPEPRRVMRFTCELPEGQQFSQDIRGGLSLAVSPDGDQFVYGTTEGLYLRSVDALEARLIAGTDKNSVGPVFSPDGKWIGYWSSSDHKLKKIAISGGAPVVLCDTGAMLVFGANWDSDDSIVYSDVQSGIMRISAGGGTPESLVKGTVTTLKEGLPAMPQMLPDGKTLLFTLMFDLNSANWQTAVQSLKSGERKVLLRSGARAKYLPTGNLVYTLAGNLFAVSFSLDKLEIGGGPVPIVENVRAADVSASGTLAYIPGMGTSASGRTLVWVDREGKEEPLGAPPSNCAYPKISPDGTRVALTISTEGNQDIWIWDLIRKTMTRLTFDKAAELQSIWTPDSKRIVFASSREGGVYSLYWKAADGTGGEEKLGSMPNLSLWPWSWSGDGKTLVTQETDTASKWDIGTLSMEGDRTRKSLLHEEATEIQPKVSPDGRWMAYMSSESGRNEVYVRPFPDVDKGKWQVSTSSGNAPRWSPDGRELFYLSDDNSVMAIAVETKSAFSLGTLRILFRSQNLGPTVGAGTPWDIHPDGKRFLMIKLPGAPSSTAAAPRKINIVLNWTEELKQRVP